MFVFSLSEITEHQHLQVVRLPVGFFGAGASLSSAQALIYCNLLNEFIYWLVFATRKIFEPGATSSMGSKKSSKRKKKSIWVFYTQIQIYLR